MPLSPALQTPEVESSGPISIHEAYRTCEDIVRRHYENFPVATAFLAPVRRLALAAIYAFARWADDLADAEAPGVERLAALGTVERAFLRALDGEPQGPILTALADTIDRYRLPTEPFLDLLEAFRLDARDATFDTWDDLLGYCSGSANPVGRLVLAVHGVDDPQTIRRSDDVCTALQLTNFWQDLGRDLARGRLFIPLEDLARFGITREDLTRRESRSSLSRLLEHECRGTEELFERGAPVVRGLPIGLSVQLRATIGGGRAVLRAVIRRGWRVLHERPTIGSLGRTRILVKALLAIDG
jgi:squalene synthase HpnC